MEKANLNIKLKRIEEYGFLNPGIVKTTMMDCPKMPGWVS